MSSPEPTVALPVISNLVILCLTFPSYWCNTVITSMICDVDVDVDVDDDVDVVNGLDDVDDVFLLAGLDRSTLELLNEEEEDPKCLKIWLRWRL